MSIEPPVAQMLARVKSVVGHVDRILEAGAHNGSDTLLLKETFPEATVHAFECVPRLFDALCARANGVNGIRPCPLALSDRNGPVTLHLSGGRSDASSSLERPEEHLDFHPQVTFDDTITVEATTLDEWASKEGVSSIDFAWLDLQGSEHRILSAAPKIRSTLRAVWSEVSLKQMYADVPLYPEFRAFMESNGFVVDFEDFRWADMGNVLFLRADDSTIAPPIK